MSVLIDTNVISEVRRPQPDANVLAWLDHIDEDRAFLSVVTLAEIQRGIALLSQGRRRTDLEEWLASDLPQRFAGRILPVDEHVALAWGHLTATAQQSGKILHAMDGLIAATALANGFSLATRNIRDFTDLPITLIDPWQAS